jgi:hypothetical protein
VCSQQGHCRPAPPAKRSCKSRVWSMVRGAPVPPGGAPPGSWRLCPLGIHKHVHTSNLYGCRSSHSLAPLPYSRPLDTPRVPDLDTVRSAMATASTVGAETGVPGDGGASKAAAGEQLAFLSAGGALLAGEPQAPSVSDASVVRAPARLPAVWHCASGLPLHPPRGPDCTPATAPATAANASARFLLPAAEREGACPWR